MEDQEDDLEAQGIDDTLTVTEGECVFLSMDALYEQGVVCVWMADGGPQVGIKGRGVLSLHDWLKDAGKVASLRPV